MSEQNILQKKFMDELGLADLPQDKQEQLMEKMTEVILKRMFVETMDALNPADHDAYEALLDREAKPEEIENFLREKIVNYDQLLEKIVKNFREEMKKEY